MQQPVPQQRLWSVTVTEECLLVGPTRLTDPDSSDTSLYYSVELGLEPIIYRPTALQSLKAVSANCKVSRYRILALHGSICVST